MKVLDLTAITRQGPTAWSPSDRPVELPLKIFGVQALMMA
jgi:hypothetical protein